MISITTIIVMLVIGILGFISGLVGIGEQLLFTRLSYYYHHYLVYLLIVLILLQRLTSSQVFLVH